MEIKTITVWEKVNPKTKKLEHNHIDDGWDDNIVSPTPVNKDQKRSWKKVEWIKKKGLLIDGTVVLEEDIRDPDWVCKNYQEPGHEEFSCPDCLEGMDKRGFLIDD